ncbi:UNVERIFIED_CONTAM: hypothetical protein GTU68_057327 [Idotea baltica]|nr:hypothetical protein [Idotea baltica]
MKFHKTTNKIHIAVNSVFIEEQSIPDNSLFVWTYTILIENKSLFEVQLMNRHWDVIDSNGLKIEVDGEGVLGEKPILKPGESFTYTSGTYIMTPSGVMQGSYTFQNLNDKSSFEVEIPAFSLDSPFEDHLPS